MFLLILKSSACLAVLMLFYKLFLEKISAHTLKRFYLIGIIIISMVIPFITFTTYIELEPVKIVSTAKVIENSSTEFIETVQPKNYLPTILWSIYALGVILFSSRFFKNLYQLVQKIRCNPKYKNQNFINVLITDLITPHTFFNYIFLNKKKFKNNLIPTEVLLHEETHAKQKHTLDVLFIEVLQIVFWFNPLLYFIKKDIKLNHEFIADQTVLNNGFNTKDYQQLLLAFSSNASHSSLANAINYSLIKKRFTVMKTKTSKRALWFRSFIILPLLAFLIYGFSQEIVVQKEVPDKANISFDRNTTIKTELYNYLLTKHLKAAKNLELSDKKDSTELKFIQERIKLIQKDIEKSDESLEKNSKEFEIEEKNNSKSINKQSTKGALIIKIINNETVYINDKKCDFENIENRIIELTKDLSSEEKEKLTPIIVYNSPGDGKILAALINKILKKHKLFRQANSFEEFIAFEEPNETPVKKTSNQQKATPEEIEEYNTLAKKFNANPEGIFKEKDIKRIILLYNKLTKEQKKTAEPFPIITPLPAPTPKSNENRDKIAETYKEIIEEKKEEINDSSKKSQEIKKFIEGRADIEKDLKTTEPVDKEPLVISLDDPLYPYILGNYNTLAHKVSKRIKRNRPIEEKTIEILKSLYSKIPKSQRKKYAVDFPIIPSEQNK